MLAAEDLLGHASYGDRDKAKKLPACKYSFWLGVRG